MAGGWTATYRVQVPSPLPPQDPSRFWRRWHLPLPPAMLPGRSVSAPVIVQLSPEPSLAFLRLWVLSPANKLAPPKARSPTIASAVSRFMIMPFLLGPGGPVG